MGYDPVPKRGHSPAISGATGSFAGPGFAAGQPYETPGEAVHDRGVREFVDEAEASAANDDHYNRSAAPSDFHESVAAGLIRGLLWWAFFMCVGFAAFAMVLR